MSEKRRVTRTVSPPGRKASMPEKCAIVAEKRERMAYWKTNRLSTSFEDLRKYFSHVSAEEWEDSRRKIEKEKRGRTKGVHHRRNQSLKSPNPLKTRSSQAQEQELAYAEGPSKRPGTQSATKKRPKGAARLIFGGTLKSGGRPGSPRGGRRVVGRDLGDGHPVLSISEPIGHVTHKVHVSDTWEWKGVGVSKAFTVLEEIGRGAYGTVHRAEHTTTGQTIAVKILPLGEEFDLAGGASEDLRVELQREMATLQNLQHVNTLTYYGCVVQPTSVWLLMEYCHYGSIKQISRSIGRGYTEPEIGEILSEVCKGLEYLHETCGVLHRDIKAQNVLVNADGRVKIADFGASAPLRIKRKATLVDRGGRSPSVDLDLPIAGTPVFMSPEVCRGEEFDSKADIWSLGVLCLELAETHPPHHRLPPGELLLLIGGERSRRTFRAMEDWSPAFHAVVDACLSLDPFERPSATELLQFAFLRHIDGGFPHVRTLLEDQARHHQACESAPNLPGERTMMTNSLTSLDGGVCPLEEEAPPDAFKRARQDVPSKFFSMSRHTHSDPRMISPTSSSSSTDSFWAGSDSQEGREEQRGGARGLLKMGRQEAELSALREENELLRGQLEAEKARRKRDIKKAEKRFQKKLREELKRRVELEQRLQAVGGEDEASTEIGESCSGR